MTSIAWAFTWAALAVLLIIAVAEFLLMVGLRRELRELEVKKLRREADAGNKKGDVDEESDTGAKGQDGGDSRRGGGDRGGGGRAGL